MNRIDAVFQRLEKRGRPAFVAYVTAGDPSLVWTARLVERLAESGCDLIELGVPYSDPLADGVVNQRAAQRALASGTTLAGILRCAKQIRRSTEISLVLFTYFNPVHRMGIEKFAREAQRVGIDGVLILDLPPEEFSQVQKVLTRHGLKMILLIAPTSSDERIAKICKSANGFIYCISRTGVTGAQESLLAEVKALVRKVKSCTKLPVVVGFGVSTPQHVRTIGRIADGVVVGSAIVAQIEKHPSDPASCVARFVKKLTRTLENFRG